LSAVGPPRSRLIVVGGGVRFAGTLLLLDFLGDCFAGGAAAPEGRLAGTGADIADRFDVEVVEAARIEWLRSAISRHVANEGLLLVVVVLARHCHAVRGSGRAHAATKGEKAGRGFIARVWMWIDVGIGG
jgi:hypothetical protein